MTFGEWLDNMNKRKLLHILIPIIGILLYGWIVINVYGSNTRCFFRGFFGIPCPGCGLSRSYMALLKGHLGEALYYHPLFVLPPLVLIIYLLRNNRYVQWLYKKKLFWICLLIIFFGVYVVRMILMFPHTLPMQFNEEAFIPRIINELSHLIK